MGTPPGCATVAPALRYREHFVAIPGLIAIFLAGWLLYPGTHFLSSDTQIWAVMMENRLHPEFLGKDLLAQYPHVGLSFYDEIVNTARRMTGLSLETVMMAHLAIFRAVMLSGAYLLAFALTRSPLAALWIAASLQMVYFIPGPTVCVFEVEPVPRGFSLSLGLLAVALVALGKRWAASWCLAAAMLFQAAMIYPLLLCLFGWTCFSSEEGRVRHRVRYWIPIVGLAGAVLALSIAAQGGSGGLFSVVPEWLREVQRLRAGYNWISLWPLSLIGVHIGLALLVWLSYWRLRDQAAPGARWFFWGIPLIGIVSIPVAWITMEHLHLMLAAQAQPARALATVYAVGLTALFSAAVIAARAKRWLECGLWLTGGYSIVFLDQTVLAGKVLTESLSVHTPWLWVPVLAAAALVAFRLQGRMPGAATVLLCILMAAPFAVYRLSFCVDIPAQDARTPEVMALSDWAARNTALDAVFLFPGFGRSTQPGVFRATARRAVYVDWKAGGQVNFDIEFASQWWERWNAAGKGEFRLSRSAAFARRGIDYLVVAPAAAPEGVAPLFANRRFAVFRTHELAGMPAQPPPPPTSAKK